VNWRALPRRAFPYLIAAAGGFLLSYAAVFLFAFPAEVLPDDGILPNVVGKTYEDAAALLQKAGFSAQQGESRFHKSIAANIVLQEDPPAGSRQKRGTNVVLALSAGQKTAEVPVTTNMSQQQARISIENTGLTLGNVMRTQVYGAFATLSLGMRILDGEGVEIDTLLAHGGMFRTAGVAQRLLAAAVGAPVAVSATAGEGGPWGMAVLAGLLAAPDDDLRTYLDGRIFAEAAPVVVEPDPADVEGYATFLGRYVAGLDIERVAATTPGLGD